MNTFIFGDIKSVGDKILLQKVKDNFNSTQYLGKKVDISKIQKKDENLIIILGSPLYNADLNLIKAYIEKDKTKPVIVIKKIKTFGAVFFKKNYEVDKITPNKVYVFSGILYLPFKYLNGKNTISEVLRTVCPADWRTFIINSKLFKN